MRTLTKIIALLLLSTTLVFAQQWQAVGEVGASTRSFWGSAQFPGQHAGSAVSLYAAPGFEWENEAGSQRARVVGFARIDSQDSERSHGDLREAYWTYLADDWDITLGVNKVFWGVAESRHLVDIVNQSDLLEDIDAEDKLGQPMINVNWQRDWGQLGLFVLPGFRERSFPGRDGRLRAPFVIDSDAAIYESGAKQHHVDIALRYSHYFGDVDVGLAYFDGTAREPRFVPGQSNIFIPVYDQIRQLSLDLQYTQDAWLWKLEALAQDSRIDRFGAVVAGFEYTFFQLGTGASDLGVILEAHYDARNQRAPQTIFDNDVFVGARWARNDAQDTSVLAGALYDVKTNERFFSVEAERRLTDAITGELVARVFSGAQSTDALRPFEQDDYVELNITWHY